MEDRICRRKPKGNIRTWKNKNQYRLGSVSGHSDCGDGGLNNYSLGMSERKRTYEDRRNAFCRGLDEIGIKYYPPKATFYVWFEAPEGVSSKEFTGKLLTEAGIVVTPGVGFGKYGEGYIRVSITIGKERLIEAVERLKNVRF